MFTSSFVPISLLLGAGLLLGLLQVCQPQLALQVLCSVGVGIATVVLGHLWQHPYAARKQGAAAHVHISSYADRGSTAGAAPLPDINLPATDAHALPQHGHSKGPSQPQPASGTPAPSAPDAPTPNTPSLATTVDSSSQSAPQTTYRALTVEVLRELELSQQSYAQKLFPEAVFSQLMTLLTQDQVRVVRGVCRDWRRLCSCTLDRLTPRMVKPQEIARTFPNLMQLDLSKCIHGVRPSYLRALIRHLPHLTELHLGRTDGVYGMVTDRCVTEVAQTRRQIKTISLAQCVHVGDPGITDVGVVLLTKLPDIKRLNLSWCIKISNAGLQRLSTAHHTLTSLNISGCPLVTEPGLCALSALTNLVTLEAASMGLSNPAITDEVLSTWEGLTGITRLCLGSMQMGSAEVSDASLAHIPLNHEHLVSLELQGLHHITDTGIQVLVQQLPQISHLVLRNCSCITQACLSTLAQLDRLERLEITHCGSMQFSTPSIRQLLGRSPGSDLVLSTWHAAAVATAAHSDGAVWPAPPAARPTSNLDILGPRGAMAGPSNLVSLLDNVRNPPPQPNPPASLPTIPTIPTTTAIATLVNPLSLLPGMAPPSTTPSTYLSTLPGSAAAALSAAVSYSDTTVPPSSIPPATTPVTLSSPDLTSCTSSSLPTLSLPTITTNCFPNFSAPSLLTGNPHLDLSSITTAGLPNLSPHPPPGAASMDTSAMMRYMDTDLLHPQPVMLSRLCALSLGSSLIGGWDGTGRGVDDTCLALLGHLGVTLKSLTIITYGDTMASFAARQGLENLSNLTSLELTGCRRITQAGLLQLARAPFMPQLQHLTLGPLGGDTNACALLAVLSSAPRLTSLYVKGAGMALDDSVLRLVAARLTCLTSLQVQDAPAVSDAGLSALAAVSALSALSALILIGCDRATGVGLGGESVLSAMANVGAQRGRSRAGPSNRGHLHEEELAAGGMDVRAQERLPRLASLSLSGGGAVSDMGLRVVRRALPSLTRLDVSQCVNVTDEGVHAIASLSLLTSLDLQHCSRISDSGVHCLTALTRLNTLKLSGCVWLSDKAAAALSALSSTLITLHLEKCIRITDTGLACLAAITSLNTLRLARCVELTDAGVATLTRLSRLSSLSLAHCSKVTVAGIMALSPLTGLASLNW